ncbi:MAG: hypothetical protein ICV59_07370 [Thermoleophilia bacterium]|nr:hypothetical protein [Thermoleophilia bacterium]
MDIVGSYLELGLRVGRHVEGLVDAYFGPAEHAERVQAEALREPVRLVDDAGALAAALDSDNALEEGRRHWLAGQVRGLETVARQLAGESIPFADEVGRCYGVRPSRIPEESFEAAHRELDGLLPGDGSVAERYLEWREGSAVGGEELATVVRALAVELRDRTARLLGLPDGERAEFEFVRDEPWTAYNYYLGNLRSRIAVNLDTPIPRSFLVELVAHEAYPGHHTEHAWKEQRLVRERSWHEEAILLIGTPQSLMAEGIAQVAVGVLLGDDEDVVAADHLGRVGVAYDAELGRRIRQARRPLEHVVPNAAFLLHEDGYSADEAREYIIRWGLVSEQRAQQSVRFVTHPIWRSYASTYTDGERLCESFVRGDPARFARLLTEQLTPADLVAETV